MIGEVADASRNDCEMDLTGTVAVSALIGAFVGFTALAVLYPVPRIALSGLLLAAAIEASPLLIAPALSRHRKRGRVATWMDGEM